MHKFRVALIDDHEIVVRGFAGLFATLPDIIDPPVEALPEHLTPQAKMTQQLRFIFIGLKHWQGLGSTE